MKLKLHVWRQESANAQGKMQTYSVDDVDADMSFLEMLDVLNESLVNKGEEPIVFDHDCREGICGACSLMINGEAHGPEKGTTTCQLHMRSFKDGDEIYIEPWRSRAFPVIKDLMVDRNALDKIQHKGGFVSINTGNAPDAHSLPIGKEIADEAFDYATCIGCGACAAQCKNSSAMLFTAAKVAHLNLLPQGQAEKDRRTIAMVEEMDAQGFGNCSNHYECEAACPKEISVKSIAKMNRDYLVASLRSEK